MKTVPSYTKVLNLGSAYTEEALNGVVSVQEKVDGSQFGFGLDQDKEVIMRSHNAQLSEDAQVGMFKEAYLYVKSIEDRIKSSFNPDTYFYCEYLQKPKHNTLKYDKTPKNHLVLFDCLNNGRWSSRSELVEISNGLDIDLIPEYSLGDMTVEAIKSFLENDSYLGGAKIEGVVIKNYNQTILLGGQVFPLFTKYVSEKFKEKHEIDWKTRQPKGSLQEYIQGFKNEARWQKSVIHATEQGLLTVSPKDIGVLMPMIRKDVEEEETENIKNFLYKCFKDDILRHSVQGFPEWYKDKLLENVN